MDINIDQAIPRNDLVRLKSGKYLYRFPNGKIDVDRLNRDFDQYKEKRKNYLQESFNDRVDNLSEEEIISPYNLPVGEIMINMKEALVGVSNDLLRHRLNSNIITKDNRLFYLGLCLIMFGILLYLLILLLF